MLLSRRKFGSCDQEIPGYLKDKLKEGNASLQALCKVSTEYCFVKQLEEKIIDNY
jgi:hypothetical protein